MLQAKRHAHWTGYLLRSWPQAQLSFQQWQVRVSAICYLVQVHSLLQSGHSDIALFNACSCICMQDKVKGA